MSKKNNSAELIAGASQSQIAEWEEKYGEVHLIRTPIDGSYDEYLECLVRRPNAQILNEFLRKMNNYPIDANILLMNTCWLSGDELIKTDDYVNSAVSKFAEIIMGGDAKLSRLDDKTPEALQDQQFLQLKAKWGALYLIEVPTDNTYENFISCIVKKPIRQMINKYLTKSDRVPIDAAKELLKSIWIDGDKEIQKDIKYVISCVKVLAEIIVGAESTIKKISVNSQN